MSHSLIFIIPPGIPVSPTVLAISIVGLIILGFIYRRSLAQQRLLIASTQTE